MPTPIVRNNAKPVVEEEHHVGIPVVRREWPAVAEHDRRTRTPVLVIDLGLVVGCNEAHFFRLLQNSDYLSIVFSSRVCVCRSMALVPTSGSTRWKCRSTPLACRKSASDRAGT